METLAQEIPFLTVLIGDFIATSKKWCSQDSTNFKGIIIEKLTCQFGLSYSCIDLIFTTQPSWIWFSPIFALKLSPTDCICKIHEKPTKNNCHYKQPNAGLIRRAVTDFNWDRAFLNTIMNEKVSIWSNTILWIY